MKTDNALIAEFIGHELQKFDSNYSYDTSWDCLMPVVEKIHALKMDISIHWFLTNSGKSIRECLIDTQDAMTISYIDSSPDSMIENTYKAVVRFIRWYNSQNK